MAFKPGETGNPFGQIREKKFLAALERAVAQDDGKRLRNAAEKLLDAASDGEAWAINQLADRLDGKPTQQMNMQVNDRNADELSENELLRIAARGSSGTVSEKGGTEKPAKLH